VVAAVESFMRDNEFVVCVDLPRMIGKEIDVELRGDVLTVKGDRKEERTARDGDYSTTERSDGLRSMQGRALAPPKRGGSNRQEPPCIAARGARPHAADGLTNWPAWVRRR
jgi:hypothetical protein